MKCVILGDSISEGIGTKHINYIPKLINYTGGRYEFVNLAKTGTTVKYAEQNIERIISENPDCVLIMYGSVDAQIRANLNGNRFGINKIIPKRYKIGGMLEPRAFYSKKLHRWFPDRADNIIRCILKKIILITEGKTQWVSMDEFRESYRKVVGSVIAQGIKVIAVSTIYLDDKFFLNSNMEYIKFNKIIIDISKDFNVDYIDLYSLLKESVKKYGWDRYYSHDHFHPNQKGYEFFAKILSDNLNRYNPGVVK